MILLQPEFNNFYLSLLLAIALVILCYKRPNTSIYLFAGLGLLMLFCMRLPVLMYNNQLNVDESQMVSNLRALAKNPIYWQSADGGTVGPATYYSALVVTLFQESIDFRSIRLVGFILLICNLLLFYKTSCLLFGKKAALQASVYVAIFFTFVIHPDFLHYSSEQFPIFLLNIAIYIQAIMYVNKKSHGLYYFFLGLIVGIIPFAKLQAIPLIAVMAVFQLFQLRQKTWPQSLMGGIVGVATFPLLLLVFLNYFNLLEDFWTYYIEDNIIYTGTNKRAYGIINVVKLLGKSFDFFFYWIGIIGVSMLIGKRKMQWLSNPIFIFIFGLLVAGLYAAVVTKNNFPHYLHFLVFPLGLLFAQALSSQSEKNTRIVLLPFILFLGWTLVEEAYMSKISAHLKLMKTNAALSISPVSNYIKSRAKEGDKMSVWGWQGKLYVEADVLQAVAENQTLHCMQESVLKQNHIHRYLQDLERSQARFVIDATQDDPGYLAPIEKVAAVNNYVLKNYTLDTTISNNRIFIRK